jgi:hypothetical protein
MLTADWSSRDRLTHKGHILELMGESYRFCQRLRRKSSKVGRGKRKKGNRRIFADHVGTFPREIVVSLSSDQRAQSAHGEVAVYGYAGTGR